MRHGRVDVLIGLRDRTMIGFILVAVGAPLAALSISTGLPETTVYYVAFVLAGIVTVFWLSRSPKRAPLNTDSAQSVRTVLLVEQEEVLRHHITELLRARNILVHSTSSPVEALSLVHRAESHFDLVLLNVNLPRLSGLDLFGILRRERPYLALILLAAYIEAWNAARAPVVRIVEASAPSPMRAELEELLNSSA